MEDVSSKIRDDPKQEQEEAKIEETRRAEAKRDEEKRKRFVT